MFFVFRILRKASDKSYIIDGTTHDTLDAAMHHFHQILSTYAYGNNANYDYVSAQVQTPDGRIIYGPEVDDRIQPEPEE